MLLNVKKNVFVLVESESEPEDVAAQVLRPLLHPVQRPHRPRGGDEQRAAARHQDALQVRPEGFLVQTPRLAQRACQGVAHVQRPGLPGDARGPALRLGHLQRPDEDPAEGLSGEFTQRSYIYLTNRTTVRNPNVFNVK